LLSVADEALRIPEFCWSREFRDRFKCCSPPAANFNIVPAALLELPGRNGVISRCSSLPPAMMLVANVVLMAVLVYRF
jgi:hypothetical protein